MQNLLKNLLFLTILISITMTSRTMELTQIEHQQQQQFLKAVTTGDIEAVEKIFAAGVNINKKKKNGLTPLMTAAYKGHYHVAQFLIENNADINEKDKEDGTALMHAARGNHANLVRLFIDNNANINATEQKGNTAVMIAAAFGQQESLKALLEKHANISLKTNKGETAEQIAKRRNQAAAAQLLEEQKKLQIKRLFTASRRGDLKRVKRNLAAGADINAIMDGETALMAAARYGHYSQIQVAKFLLENNANPFLKNSNNETAFDIAKKENNTEIAELIRKNMKQIEHNLEQEIEGCNPLLEKTIRRLDLAEIKKFLKIIGKPSKRILEKINKNGVLVEMIIADDLEGIKLLFKIGANKESPNNLLISITPLIAAVYYNNPKIVKFLLAKGVNPDTQDKQGLTALINAATSGNSTIVKLLLEESADSTIQDMHGSTALMYAVRNNHPETVKLLLEANTDPNIKDQSGLTMLMHAAIYGRKEIVKLLVDAGADKSLTDNTGYRTALIYAQQQYNSEPVSGIPPSFRIPSLPTERDYAEIIALLSDE